MRLIIDDDKEYRPTQPDFDIRCWTVAQAIWALQNYPITHISFDNDLGPEYAGQGYQVADWIEEQAHFGKIEPMTWEIHSANCSRWGHITAAMKNADKYWRFRRGRQ